MYIRNIVIYGHKISVIIQAKTWNEKTLEAMKKDENDKLNGNY